MSQIGALVGGLWGDAGENFVNEQGGADKVFGTKPKVADFTPVDLGDEIGKATGFNLENLDAIKGLLNNILPGFSDILGQQQQTTSQLFDNAASLLHGELPKDVLDQINRSTAYKALSGGYGGTPMKSALTARDIGRTSVDLLGMGANMATAGGNAAQSWAKLAEEAFSPFIVSTGQTAGTTAANNAGIQAQQQFQYNVDAAPDPGALGIFNVDAALGQQMLSFGMSSLGGIGGGGGGQATAQGPGGTGSAQAPASGYSLGGGYAAAYNPTNPYVGIFNTAGTWGGGGYGGGG